jgi:hypothetical protein
MKPLGSEKLTGQDKINRIIEIASYGQSKNQVTESTTEYTKRAVDGNTYAIVRENDGYYVKTGLNESTLDYPTGMLNKSKYKFSSYAGALRKLNIMLKPINEAYNEGNEDPVLNEKKYVLKTPKPAAVDLESSADEPVLDVPTERPEPMDDDMSDIDLDFDIEDDTEMEDAPSDEMSDEPNKIKKIQKLTGKLGQALREAEVDLESSDIKYVLNSIISAVDLTNLDAEDLEDVMENFEELEEMDMDAEPSMGDEDMDLSDFMDDEEMSDEDMADEELAEEMVAPLDGDFPLDDMMGDVEDEDTKEPSEEMSEEDDAEEEDDETKMEKILKNLEVNDETIEHLGSMIFGLNESEDINRKIDNVLNKYFN